jgi:hypothetical protein
MPHSRETATKISQPQLAGVIAQRKGPNLEVCRLSDADSVGCAGSWIPGMLPVCQTEMPIVHNWIKLSKDAKFKPHRPIYHKMLMQQILKSYFSLNFTIDMTFG